jgi:hypothetical protein
MVEVLDMRLWLAGYAGDGCDSYGYATLAVTPTLYTQKAHRTPTEKLLPRARGCCLAKDGSYPLDDTSPKLAVTWLWDRIYSSELSTHINPYDWVQHPSSMLIEPKWSSFFKPKRSGSSLQIESLLSPSFLWELWEPCELSSPLAPILWEPSSSSVRGVIHESMNQWIND